MSMGSGMCGSSSGLAVARFADDCRTCGDPRSPPGIRSGVPDSARRAGCGASQGHRPPLGKASRLSCETAGTPARSTHPRPHAHPARTSPARPRSADAPPDSQPDLDPRPRKLINEYVGGVNTQTDSISIAHMRAPAGWEEPFQTPEFDEYTLVLRGSIRVEHDGGQTNIAAGQAILTAKPASASATRRSRSASTWPSACPRSRPTACSGRTPRSGYATAMRPVPALLASASASIALARMSAAL